MYVGIVCSVLVLMIMFTDMYYIRFTHVHICVVYLYKCSQCYSAT